MQKSQNTPFQEETDIKFLELASRNYKFFAISIIIVVTLAFLVNHFSMPIYKISASMLIKEESRTAQKDVNDYLNSNLFTAIRTFRMNFGS